MPDHSELDSRYFVDKYVYNCPFCNRRNVDYLVSREFQFDWSEDKVCYVYFVFCTSCRKRSMHLSFTEILLHQATKVGHGFHNRFALEEGVTPDGLFFYSVPTTYFVLNDHIPAQLRTLFSEAEGCLKSNFLTGASACARKIIYELAVLQNAEGEHYEDRIKSLKGRLPHVEPAYFDTLLTVQELTSSKVHENALDNWEAKHLRAILAALKEILDEIYVLPKIRQAKRKAVLDLRQRLLPKKSDKTS